LKKEKKEKEKNEQPSEKIQLIKNSKKPTQEQITPLDLQNSRRRSELDRLEHLQHIIKLSIDISTNLPN